MLNKLLLWQFGCLIFCIVRVLKSKSLNSQYGAAQILYRNNVSFMLPVTGPTWRGPPAPPQHLSPFCSLKGKHKNSPNIACSISTLSLKATSCWFTLSWVFGAAGHESPNVRPPCFQIAGQLIAFLCLRYGCGELTEMSFKLCNNRRQSNIRQQVGLIPAWMGPLGQMWLIVSFKGAVAIIGHRSEAKEYPPKSVAF